MKKLLLLLLLAGFLPAAHAQRRPISTIPQLTDSLQRIMHRDHIPGLLLTIVTRDSVLFEGGLGLANVAQQKPVTAHTLFRIGSVTKSFVAAGLMQLVVQGRLSLNDEVHKLAPEVPIDNPWEATDPVRVVHLLEHTAGFDDMHLTHVYNTTATIPRGAAGVQVFRDELHCRWRPGERMSYSNPGYLVAGYLLEKISGQPYEEYLTQHLLRPLGMQTATFALRAAALPELAQSYRFANGQYKALPAHPIYAGPAGSLSASATDMTHWIQFFLRGFEPAAGQPVVLPPTALRDIETVHSTLAARAGLPVGYALANVPMNGKGKAIFRGHNGGIDGFASTFAYQRELGVGYALSGNGSQGTQDLDKLIREFLTRRAPAPPTPATVPLDAAAVAPYLGHYRPAAPRQAVAGIGDYLVGGRELVQRGQLLLFQPLFGAPDTLLPTGPLTFRRPGHQQASFVLTHDRDGRRAIAAISLYALETSNTWWWLRPALLGLAALLWLSSSVAGLVWAVLAVRRLVPRGQVLPRLLPLLASAVLIATVVGFLHLVDNIEQLGSSGLLTVLISLGPPLFAGLLLIGLLLTLRHFRRFRSRVVLWFLLLTYASLGWMAVVIGSHGWLNLRLWTV